MYISYLQAYGNLFRHLSLPAKVAPYEVSRADRMKMDILK